MQLSKYTKASVQIIFMFLVAIAFSFLPDQFPEFFGDYVCEGKIYNRELGLYQGCDNPMDSHDSRLHWGYRHWLFCGMGLVLFIVQMGKFFAIIEEEQS